MGFILTLRDFLYNFGMWIEFNENPCGYRVGDCSVRAVSVALGVDWRTAYALMVTAGYKMCDVPSSDRVWTQVLKDHGFRKTSVEDITAEEFCEDHPHGTYVLGFGGHVATVKDGRLFDSWNSSKEIVRFVLYRPKTE